MAAVNVVPVVAAEPAVGSIDQKRMAILKNLAIAETVFGVIMFLLPIVAAITLAPVYIFVQIPNAIVIIVAGSIICCGCSTNPAGSQCRIRAHMVLAIIACVLELTSLGLNATVIAALRLFVFYPINFIVIPALSLIFNIINCGLLLWSSILSGQLGCCPTQTVPAQVGYVQSVTGGPPQMVVVQPGQPQMVQPAAQPVQQPPAYDQKPAVQ